MEQSSNGKAIGSLVCGIISVTCFLGLSIYTNVIGLILGIIAIALGNRARRAYPSGIATAGFICGIVGTVLCSLITASCLCGLALFSNLVSTASAYHSF